ncbi:hypothetical protein Tco_0895266 [Tanacetum coccineum]|uniref:Uncharacterized protein n=1 Tax=Tanacetum coccineum TaxID=301880 RepID=A0ABQ5CKC3_9ASTR
MNEPVYRELVWEFFASFEFDSSPCRYNSTHVGVSFWLGGETKTMSLLELGWRIGLYSEEESRLDGIRRRLNKGETVRAEILTMGFWPSIGDGEFVMGGTAVKKVRDLKVRLAHRYIAITISGRKESTHRITTNDLFFLYCIYGEGVTCNIPYWLTQYLKSVRDKDLTCGGMFVTRIARSFRLLTSFMVDALNVEPKAHILKKKSLISMNVVMDLGKGACCWLATRQVKEYDEVEEVSNEEVGGSTEVYRNMSRGDWLYLMRRSLEVLRKFHYTILGGRFNQLSHVSSPLLSKPREY